MTRIEEWDQRYRAGEQISETPTHLVVEFAGGLAPGCALDLACGPGRNSLYLAERGWSVTAADGSSVAIELLRKRAEERKLSINAEVVDLEAGKFGIPVAAFHLVLSCYYLQRSFIPSMRSAVRPGGLLIMIVHLAEPGQPRGTPTRAYPGELQAFFDGWSILHLREGEPGESGHRHAVAELVAQKPG